MALVHLHRHGEYSLLDGLGTGKQYSKLAAEMGQPALAITDHGTMAGVLYHIEACKGVDHQGNKIHDPIRPIVGMEAYFRADINADRENKAQYAYHHLVLLAKSMEGFRNLMRLSSASYQPANFYGKPCLGWGLLKSYSEGLIATSSCPAGIINSAALDPTVEGDPDDLLRQFISVYGDDFFIEIQPHDWEGQKKVNELAVELATRHSVPMIATSDAHYPARDDYDTHQALIAIRTNTTLKERAQLREEGNDPIFSGADTLYLMSSKEMTEMFYAYHPDISRHISEAISNTEEEVLARIEDYEISREPKLPRATRSKMEAERVIREWCNEGLKRIGKVGNPEYEERLERELGVMKRRDVLDYFVIVGRTVRKAKETGIRVGPGRGSAAGSLVAYLSRITAIDPIGYDLSFERFMSEYRLELPDIDVDFQHTKRDLVKEQIKEEFGHDHVTDVAAFSTFQMKSAVKDVGRAYDVPFEETARVAKEIDALTNKHQEQHLEDIAEASELVQKYSQDYPEAWEHAKKLEGQIKGISKHPAAVVITDKPVSEYMPIMRAANSETEFVSQWAERADFHAITNFGFLKMDILSLDDLTTQQHCIDLVRERRGVEIDFEDPKKFPAIESPFNTDPEVLEFFGKGPYLGIHQFMSRGITQLLKDIAPDSIDDIIAANALFRPGPIKSGICFEYPGLKNGRDPVREWHPLVEPYLRRTFGLIVYQEQVMAIIAQLGGFDPQESYIVFKSMTKWHVSKQRGIKGTEKLKPLVNKFVDGCVSHGIAKKEAMKIWEGIAAMSHYSFNRSHSSGYALEAYQDAWLKVNYPLEFYASLLTWEPNMVPRIIREARNQGISILPPDVNVSEQDFTIVGNAIRFGLPSIKGVAGSATGEILAKRPFSSFEDFKAKCEKRKCNRKVLKALVMCGAFDTLGGRSKWTIDEAGDIHPGAYTDSERAKMEKELLGFSLAVKSSISKHKAAVEDRLDSEEVLAKFGDGDEAFVGGELIRLKEIQTKKGDPMAFADFEFEGDEYSVTFFTEQYERHRHLLNEGAGLLVKGKWQPDRHCVIADAVCTVDNYVEALKDD